MTVFKTFFKIIKKYKAMILLYTTLLIIFGGINLSTNNNGTNFTTEKPDILIINKDKNIGLTKNLTNYLKKHTNVKKIETKEEKINDALFYRDVNYIIYIKENYRKDILAGKNPKIDIKTTKDYNASLAEQILTRYLKIQNIYTKNMKNEKEIIKSINKSLENQTEIEITSKINKTEAEKMNLYFNFASYSLMAVIIFIICFILSSFKSIHKRIIVSSMNYKKHNRIILKASLLYVLVIWLLFSLLGIILLKDTILSVKGIIYILNALIFCLCSLTIALVISSLTNNKEAISGIVNVVALGSAFLCGAFVPSKWLPKNVLTLAHILPSYWYIQSNELLKKIEIINFKTIAPILQNMTILLLFSTLFIIINNKITKQKQKIG